MNSGPNHHGLPERVRRLADEAVYGQGMRLNRKPWLDDSGQDTQKTSSELQMALSKVEEALQHPVLKDRAFLVAQRTELTTLISMAGEGKHIDPARVERAVANAEASASVISNTSTLAHTARMAMEQGTFTAEQRGEIHRELYNSSPEYRAASDKAAAEIRAEQPETAKRQAKIMGLAAELGLDSDESSRKIATIRRAKEKALADGNILEAARLEAEEQSELAAQSAQNRQVADKRGTPDQKARAAAQDDEQQDAKDKAIQRYRDLYNVGIKAARDKGDNVLADQMEQDRDNSIGKMHKGSVDAEQIDSATDIEAALRDQKDGNGDPIKYKRGNTPLVISESSIVGLKKDNTVPETTNVAFNSDEDELGNDSVVANIEPEKPFGPSKSSEPAKLVVTEADPSIAKVPTPFRVGAVDAQSGMLGQA